jgi:hypothetical protein
MLKSVWCTYNINEPICQWSLFVLSLGAAWLPRHTPGTSDPGENGAARKQSKRVCWTKRSYNGSGQERRYGGKFVCAPCLSK